MRIGMLFCPYYPVIRDFESIASDTIYFKSNFDDRFTNTAEALYDNAD
jgi:hypothetical protein